MMNKIKSLFSRYCEEPRVEIGMFDEDYFREMLAIERKRTERSHKPFFFMLIDLSNLLLEKGQGESIIKVIHAVRASTREIDIKGWYSKGKVFGVIFTEVEAASQAYILDKVRTNLSRYLNPDQVKRIEITFSRFPDELAEQADTKHVVEMFYPDLHEQPDKARVSSMKRAVDVLGSLAVIILLSPLFLLIAIVVKLSSKGPVIFRQTRLGLGGREFTFLKFRSMYSNADTSLHERYIQLLIEGEKNGDHEKPGVWRKLSNDPRITPLGAFLRKTSLDELPQLFNVLKGEMTLVGPRPPIPYEYRKYETWHKRRVLEVKPGITGLWQVKGRSATTFDNMVRMDLKYSQQWSLWLDLKLLSQTPLTVFSTRGAG